METEAGKISVEVQMPSYAWWKMEAKICRYMHMSLSNLWQASLPTWISFLHGCGVDGKDRQEGLIAVALAIDVA
jgi:hypothetical protein